MITLRKAEQLLSEDKPVSILPLLFDRELKRHVRLLEMSALQASVLGESEAANCLRTAKAAVEDARGYMGKDSK